jgi:hypothetical protein
MNSSALPNNWRKSLHSGGQAECVEVADNVKVGRIRDSKYREGGSIILPRDAFDAFLSVVLATA